MWYNEKMKISCSLPCGSTSGQPKVRKRKEQALCLLFSYSWSFYCFLMVWFSDVIPLIVPFVSPPYPTCYISVLPELEAALCFDKETLGRLEEFPEGLTISFIVGAGDFYNDNNKYTENFFFFPYCQIIFRARTLSRLFRKPYGRFAIAARNASCSLKICSVSV